MPFTADAGLDGVAVSGSAPRSTGSHSSARLGRSTTSVTGMRMASMDADTDTIAKAKPNRAVRKVSNGAIMMPPALAPFSAQLTANPRRLSNHAATMMLMAAPLIVAHPTDITANAAYKCQGRDGIATGSRLGRMRPRSLSTRLHIRRRILHGRSNYPDLLSSGLSGATGPLGECRVLWFGSRRGAGGLPAMPSLPTRDGTGKPGVQRNRNDSGARYASYRRRVPG
jgi:hypothetical protein